MLAGAVRQTASPKGWNAFGLTASGSGLIPGTALGPAVAPIHFDASALWQTACSEFRLAIDLVATRSATGRSPALAAADSRLQVFAASVRKTAGAGVGKAGRRFAGGCLALGTTAELQAFQHFEVVAGAFGRKTAGLCGGLASYIGASRPYCLRHAASHTANHRKQFVAGQILETAGDHIFGAIDGFARRPRLLRAAIDGKAIKRRQHGARLVGETASHRNGLALECCAVGPDRLRTTTYIETCNRGKMRTFTIRKTTGCRRCRTLNR